MQTKQPKDTRILLVDDDSEFRDAMAFPFKKHGYQVLFASNGREAFDLIQKDPVDVVISDIRMPGGDGVELLDRTRANHLTAPIVLLITGFADITTEEAYNRGAEALFSKPFSHKILEEAIQRLLTPPAERWANETNQQNAELKVQLHFPGLTDAIEAKVLNIGRGGMFVSIPQDRFPQVSDAMEFIITFNESGGSLKGSGIVRWIRTRSSPQFPKGCGIEFTYLGEKERAQILELVAKRKPKAFIPNQ